MSTCCCDLFYATDTHHDPACPRSSNHGYWRECERRGVSMYDHLPLRTAQVRSSAEGNELLSPALKPSE